MDANTNKQSQTRFSEICCRCQTSLYSPSPTRLPQIHWSHAGRASVALHHPLNPSARSCVPLISPFPLLWPLPPPNTHTSCLIHCLVLFFTNLSHIYSILSSWFCMSSVCGAWWLHQKSLSIQWAVVYFGSCGAVLSSGFLAMSSGWSRELLIVSWLKQPSHQICACEFLLQGGAKPGDYWRSSCDRSLEKK